MTSTRRPAEIVDSHVHMGTLAEEANLLAIRDTTGIDRMALVAIQEPATGSGVPQALFMKARHPDRFFVFAGLNHAGRLSGGAVAAPSLIEQVDAFMRAGCDGIKMIEGKPTSRRQMNVPVTDVYFRDYWKRVEEAELPIVWHVSDPEEFWDPARLPRWAAERNWGYGPGDARKEALYSEVDQILRSHPRLKVVFAHFYFLSADLPRAARFLDAHPSVRLDLAPGIEMLYNISRDPAAGREFFMAYADRIVFGTDLAGSLKVHEGKIRAGLVLRWLESADEFRLPTHADVLLGSPEDGVIRGLALPADVLRRICRDNFVALAGARPKPIDAVAVVDLCDRLSIVAEAMSGTPRANTEAARVARSLSDPGRAADGASAALS